MALVLPWTAAGPWSPDIFRLHELLANPEYKRNPWHVSKPLKLLNAVGIGTQAAFPGYVWKKICALILMQDVSHSELQHAQ